MIANNELQWSNTILQTTRFQHDQEEEEHRTMGSNNNVPNTGFLILARDPSTDLTLLSIQPLNCSKEKGEGRYESTYLLAFVQRTLCLCSC